MKDYPLIIENWGDDVYAVGSKGHHDPDLFMQKVKDEEYDWPLGVPQHIFFKAVPDSTGERRTSYIVSTEKTRGAFPATLSVEAYGDEQYVKPS